VKAKSSGDAIEGIQIWYEDSELCRTDAEGKFDAFVNWGDTVNFSFRDIDGNEFGAFHDKDSAFAINPGYYNETLQDSLYFTVYLSEIEE